MSQLLVIKKTFFINKNLVKQIIYKKKEDQLINLIEKYLMKN